MSEPSASECTLRDDGRCEVTGLSPLLCERHAVGRTILSVTPPETDKIVRPTACVPCQHHNDYFGGIL